MSESKPRLICPACGTALRWVPEAAGRKVPCKCGALLRYPREPGGEVKIERPAPAKTPDPVPQPREIEPTAVETALPDELKLDDDLMVEDQSLALQMPETETAELRKGGCPSCGKPVKPGAVICLECGYNLQSGQKLRTDLDGRPGAGGKRAASPSGGGGLLLVLKIFAFIFNGLLICMGALSLVTLNWCGIIAFLSTGIYNTTALIKGELEGASLVFAIICNVITFIEGLLLGALAMFFISGALSKNPQFQQALAQFPSWFMQVLGLVVGGMSAVLLLSGVTTFAVLLLARRER